MAYDILACTIQPSEDLAERFYKCTTCLNCKYTCPAGIEVATIVEASRRRMVDAGYLPRVLEPLFARMKGKGNPFGEPRAKMTEIYTSIYKLAEGPRR